MTNPMIKRVARALCIAAGHSPDSTCDIAVVGDPDAIYAWAGYCSDARAAIEALREPTEAMMIAGVHSNDIKGYTDDDSSRLDRCTDLVTAYPAMIDAALKED